MKLPPLLIVDDERNIVELLRLYLEKEGMAVVAAADGEEALRLHARHDPSLVILDLMLPGEDGLAICRRLRGTGALYARGTSASRGVSLRPEG